MLNSTHPFTPEQIEHHIRAILSPHSILFGAIAMLANHIMAAPPLWQALAFFSLAMMVLDVITGTIRAGYRRKLKPCEQPDKDDCSMRQKPALCNFNSRDFGATIIKGLVYGCFFLICTMLDITTGMVLAKAPGYAMAIMALGIIAGRELLSNLENLKGMCMAVNIPWPFKKVEEKLTDTFEAITGDNSTDDPKDAPAEESETKTSSE